MPRLTGKASTDEALEEKFGISGSSGTKNFKYHRKETLIGGNDDDGSN